MENLWHQCSSCHDWDDHLDVQAITGNKDLPAAAALINVVSNIRQGMACASVEANPNLLISSCIEKASQYFQEKVHSDVL
jgi:hypothetical protein